MSDTESSNSGMSQVSYEEEDGMSQQSYEEEDGMSQVSYEEEEEEEESDVGLLQASCRTDNENSTPVALVSPLQNMNEAEIKYSQYNMISIPGLKDAIFEGRWDDCVYLLKKKIGVNSLEVKQLQYVKEYKNLIDMAFQKGYKDLIILLIYNGYPVNKENASEKIYYTASDPLLLLSLKYNIQECTHLLLEKNANVNCHGLFGETPLHICALEGLIDLMHVLMSKGANITARDNNDNSVLHYAVRGNQYDAVKLLLDKQIDTDLRGIHGNTALHECIEKGYENIFTLLYEGGASINSRNNDKETPLIIAVKYHRTSIVERLLKDPFCDIAAEFIHKYSDDNTQTKCKIITLAHRTALSLATFLKYSDIIELFNNRK